MSKPFSAKQAGMVQHINPNNIHRKTQVWCGQEGWLQLGEVARRTEEDIAQYFKAQPLRARQAICPRVKWGDYIWQCSHQSIENYSHHHHKDES